MIDRAHTLGADGWVPALDDAWARTDSFAVSPSGLAPFDGPPRWRTGHVVLETSGSTGAPRRVVLSKVRMEALARALTSAQRGAEVETVVCALPLHYSFALVNQWLWSRVERKPLVVTQGFRAPDELRDALLAAPSSMVCLVGAQVALAGRAFGDSVFPGVIRLHFAGGPFPQSSLGELTRMFPSALLTNNYGCTEAGPRLTTREAQASDDPADVGAPLPGVELARTDEGTVAFRSPFGAVGIGEADRWREVSADEWLDTGDLGDPLANGSWRIAGRSGEVFKRYGEKLSLPEVLAAVRRVWPHEACALREVDAGQEPGYVLVLAPTPSEDAVRALLSSFRDRPRASWPLAIDSASLLPITDNGKVDTVEIARTPRQRHWQQR